jgi:hypothetical protein
MQTRYNSSYDYFRKWLHVLFPPNFFSYKFNKVLELKISKRGDFRCHLYKDKGQNLVAYTLLPYANTNENVQIPLTSCDIMQCEDWTTTKGWKEVESTL